MLALLAATVVAAAVPTVPCGHRAEPSPPMPTARHWVIAGPAAFAAKHPGVNAVDGVVVKKAGLSVDAGKPVTLRVLTRGAGLQYRRTRREARLSDTDRVVRIQPCAPETPSFSKKGATVGVRTGFAGGIVADRRKCVRVQVSRDGVSWVARVPVGVRRCSATTGPERCSSLRASRPMRISWVQPSPYTSDPIARTCSR
jgi:hypothetical protein